jgi:ABC-2 type transport system permease protein
MRNIMTLARKDLRLLWRDKFGLFWVIAFPLLIAVFFGTIFSGGGGGGRSAISVAAVDLDSSETSRAFVQQMQESDALKVVELDLETARSRVRQGKVTAFVVIGKGYSDGPPAFFGGESNLRIGIDPARRAESAYLRGIITQLSFEQIQRLWTDREYADRQLGQIMTEIDSSTTISENDRGLLSGFFSSLDSLVQYVDSGIMSQDLEGSGIEVESVSREPQKGVPRSAFEVTFPSAILWALLGCAATFGISIVKERNAGTYLRLRLAPLSRAHILAGKGMACFISCLGVSLMLILLGRLVFGVRTDQPLLLAVALVSAAVCFVGIMMAMSVLGKTEDSVAGAGWAILLVMAMLGGGMMPLFFMPGWLRAISSISPVKWGILALEGAVWRDFSIGELLLPVVILWGVGIAFFAIGVFVFSRSEV